MSENIPHKANPATPFHEPAVDPVVIDSEFLIRQAFAENVRTGYELLFRRYYRSLCSQAVRFVHSRTIAEDIVSEVFLSFWKNQVHQHITTSYQAYLYVAVRKRACSQLRREFLPQPLSVETESDVADSPFSMDPEQLLQYTELYQRIEETVRTLPPQCQRVFVMSRFEGKKHREIADELQISPKTIEAHLSRALAQLRRALRVGLLIWISSFLSSTPPTLPNPGTSVKLSRAL